MLKEFLIINRVIKRENYKPSSRFDNMLFDVCSNESKIRKVSQLQARTFYESVILIAGFLLPLCFVRSMHAITL